MNVRESRRTRHLVVRLDRGDELPAALVRALEEADARAAWIAGAGALEEVELAVYNQDNKSAGEPRRVEGSCEALSISGSVALADGATTVRLWAMLARETGLGLTAFGGQLTWARAFALELDVTVFDDIVLTRVVDDRTGLPLLASRSAGATMPPPTQDVSPKPAFASAPALQAIPLPAPLPVVTPPPAAVAPPHSDGPPIPLRPKPRDDSFEAYPEAGDTVTHFHFGECTVLQSDGDRIRLRQDREGKVREVALTMLKIEEPEVLPDGHRHFKLGRKN